MYMIFGLASASRDGVQPEIMEIPMPAIKKMISGLIEFISLIKI
jgi:hypothetical protein